jgi:hypothetical protein
LLIHVVYMRPATGALNLSATGVTTDASGCIPVDPFLNTVTPGVYAVRRSTCTSVPASLRCTGLTHGCRSRHTSPTPAPLHATLIDWPYLCTLPPRWAMCWARLTSRPQLSSPVGCWRTDWFVRAAISNSASTHSLLLLLLLRSLNRHFQRFRLYQFVLPDGCISFPLFPRQFSGRPDAAMDFTNIPTVLFSHPPSGTVGISEVSVQQSRVTSGHEG